RAREAFPAASWLILVDEVRPRSHSTGFGSVSSFGYRVAAIEADSGKLAGDRVFDHTAHCWPEGTFVLCLVDQQLYHLQLPSLRDAAPPTAADRDAFERSPKFACRRPSDVRVANGWLRFAGGPSKWALALAPKNYGTVVAPEAAPAFQRYRNLP